MKFDDTIAYIGEFGPYQIWINFLMCLPCITIAMQAIGSVFTMGTPDHRCRLPEIQNDTYRVQNPDHEAYVNVSIPREADVALSKCRLYNLTGEDVPTAGRYQSYECSHWVYDSSDFSSTLITELSLVCQDKMGRSHVQMFFMLGSLFGNLVLGPAADVFGRKKLLMVGICLHFAAAFPIAFTSSYIYLCFFTFLNGTASNALYTVLYVIGVEFVGPSKRVYAGYMSAIAFGAGVVILSGLAYLIRDWRYLQLATTSSITLFFIYYWLVPESPRWLITRGRYQAGNRILLKMAQVNHKELPGFALEWETDNLHMTQEPPAQAPLWNIVTYRRLLVRTLVICMNWLVLCMGYYGLSLNVGQLGGSIYFNCLVFGLVETLASLICMLLLERTGRKKLHLTLMCLTGLACCASPFPTVYAGTDFEWLSITFATIGKFGVSGAFATMWIYSSEMFPTVVRNSGMSASSLSGRIGGIISPYVANLSVTVSGKMGQILPLLIIGILSLVAGLLSLSLPETRNVKLPETLEDANEFGKNLSLLKVSAHDQEDLKKPGLEALLGNNAEKMSQEKRQNDTVV